MTLPRHDFLEELSEGKITTVLKILGVKGSDNPVVKSAHKCIDNLCADYTTITY